MNDFWKKGFWCILPQWKLQHLLPMLSQKYLQFHKKELVIWHCKGLYCIKLRHLRHCKISIVMMLCFCCLLNLFWWLILDVCYFVYPSLKCDTFSSVGFIRQFYSKRLNCSFFTKLEKFSDFSNRKRLSLTISKYILYFAKVSLAILSYR